MTTSFEAGPLAGAGSFRCEECSFPVALHQGDEVPSCPSCGGSTFRRSSLFGETRVTPAPVTEAANPDWLAETRDALARRGDYLAFEEADRVRVVPLGDGWTRVGRSLSAHVRLDDPTVSRRHALICRDADGGAKVLDDRSLNGVYRNGERIEFADLSDGDVLSLGRFTLHFVHLAADRAAQNAAPGTGGKHD